MTDSFFETARSEYVRFCNSQGLSARNIVDLSIDASTENISLINKDRTVVAKLNKDFKVISIYHGART